MERQSGTESVKRREWRDEAREVSRDQVQQDQSSFQTLVLTQDNSLISIRITLKDTAIFFVSLYIAKNGYIRSS